MPIQPSNNAKPTPGPITRVGLFFYQLDGHPKAQANLWSCSFRPNNNYDESWAKAAAELFHEAGTVYHETGLTPRQLVEQRAELIAALRGIIEIGKRDLSNMKYDGFFTTARAILAKVQS